VKVRSLFLPLLVAVPLLIPAGASAAAYLRVVSWNSRHAGWSGETNWSGYANQIWQQYGSTSTSPNGCDLVFIQECMYSSSAASLASAMTTASGVTWNYSVTAPIGRTSYKECYAVLYRTDRVSLLSATVYNDTLDKFEREPQIVKVRDNSTNADFTFINFHSIFGTAAERQQEAIDITAVFTSVQNGSSTDQDVILLGDHNLDATHAAWNTLKATSPAVSYKVNDLTSLNSSCAYANAYDHFWYQSSYVTEYSSSGRDYVANNCTLYGLSDHAPVYLKLYSSSDTD
jgi:endonuclease/exonuclease/phosphatase family metal-dependent hydrolase